jgi:hypothetical protein
MSSAQKLKRLEHSSEQEVRKTIPLGSSLLSACLGMAIVPKKKQK